MNLFDNLAALGWAAGVIDGEGCITCLVGRRKTGTPYWSIDVSVNNTDPRMPARMQALFGVGYLGQAKRSRRPRERPTYCWEVASRQAEVVLRAVLPHLVIKREQAEIALAIADTMHRKGRPITWTGSNRGASVKRLKPEIVVARTALVAQLKVLKRNPPIEEVG